MKFTGDVYDLHTTARESGRVTVIRGILKCRKNELELTSTKGLFIRKSADGPPPGSALFVAQERRIFCGEVVGLSLRGSVWS